MKFKTCNELIMIIKADTSNFAIIAISKLVKLWNIFLNLYTFLMLWICKIRNNLLYKKTWLEIYILSEPYYLFNPETLLISFSYPYYIIHHLLAFSYLTTIFIWLNIKNNNFYQNMNRIWLFNIILRRLKNIKYF